jgi:spermidine synthase
MSAFNTSNITVTPSNSRDTLIRDGWFGETEAMWPGQKFCIEVDEVLLNGRSEFQDILVFKSKTYGNVLILDGVIQVTERDEFA